jgi:uncharacterized protein
MGKGSPLFRRTRLIEARIDEFLDHISEAGIIFRRAVKSYLQSGPAEEFDDAMHQVADIESRADELRRTIEAELYERTLIPDLRADVMTLLEDMDDLLNICEANCYHFSIETPEIPDEFHASFNNLTETASESIDAVVMAGRAYFRNTEAVRDHTHKVILLESEADKISTRLKRAIFTSDIPKVEKLHLRDFVDRIDELPNAAEDIADQLGIFTVKRTV